MRKIAFFLAMLLMPCVSFAGLLSSSSPVTPVSKEYKQQLMGSPVYIQIFKEERTLDLYVKMGEQYQLLDSYKICNYSGGLGPKRRQGDFKSPEGFYSVQRNQLKPDSRFYKAINIGFPNAYDRAHGYDGKYLMIHGACVSVGCYAMTDSGIDEIFQFGVATLVDQDMEIDFSSQTTPNDVVTVIATQPLTGNETWQKIMPGEWALFCLGERII
ncbi:L,D-transpeptidase family protein [Salmonella enterica subsp. enterica serovar Enteritidis]|nr:L,D-transpeptidase family protein [Salmonella enterica subsp. enterica serovar Enteritidis]